MVKYSIPILMYHLVTPQTGIIPHKYRVTPKMFAAQMRWLAVMGYTPITLDTLPSAHTDPTGLPSRPVVITFDDGCRDCFTYALPILQARNFTAVFFLVTGLIDGIATWLIERWNIKIPMITWPEAQQLVAAGMQCGSHTVSHPHLAGVDSVTGWHELHDSRLKLEDCLGHPVQHLAYPYGSFDAQVRDIAAACGYTTACTTIKGLVTPNADHLTLRRVPINGQDSLLDFAWRLRLGHNVHETFQVAARRIRRTLRLQAA